MYKILSALGLIVPCSMLGFWFMYTSIVPQVLASSLGPMSEDFIPKVPPLLTVNFEEITFMNRVVQLDGLKCKKCMFQNVTLEYSGGEFELRETSWKPGTIKVVFKGAASNALQLVALAQSMTSPPIPKAVPQKPKPKEIPIKADMNIDWVVR